MKMQGDTQPELGKLINARDLCRAAGCSELAAVLDEQIAAHLKKSIAEKKRQANLVAALTLLRVAAKLIGKAGYNEIARRLKEKTVCLENEVDEQYR